MNRMLTPSLAGVLILAAAHAQTDSNQPAAASPVSPTNSPPIEILSDTLKGVLTNKTLVALYQGNVRVTDPRFRMTAEALTVTVPVAGGHPEHMLAERNVYLVALDEKGRTNTAKGNRLDYTYRIERGATNKLVTLTGSPAVVVTPDGTITSDRIDGDLIRGTFDGGTNVRMTINPEALGAATNSPGFDFLKSPLKK